jgi:hypothetical protein
VRVYALHVADGILQPASLQQIALLDEVEERVVGPRHIAEAPVPGGRLDDRLGGAAEKPLRRAQPQCQIVIPQRQLRLDQPGGVRHQARRHLEKGGGNREWVGHSDAVLGALPLEKFGNEFPAPFGDLVRQLSGVGKSILGLAITG